MQIVVSEILTSYEELGNGKDTILILPGWKRLAQEWVPVAKELSKKYRVVLLNLPGFGATQNFKKIAGVYEYANFVRDFLSKVKIKKCIVLGHSFGGRLGLILASENDLAEKLILVDSAGIEKKGFIAKTIRIFKKIFHPMFVLSPQQIKTKVGNTIGSEDYKNSGEMRETFKKIVNQNLTGLFHRVKIPTLIIWGEEDKSLPVSQARIFKNGIKKSTVRIAISCYFI